jgi:hypothetical protein
MLDLALFPPAIAILAAAGSVLIFVWTLRGWFSNQFSKIFDKIEKSENNIMSKLEYHERHDDERFARMGDRIWELKVGQASINKKVNGAKDNGA